MRRWNVVTSWILVVLALIAVPASLDAQKRSRDVIKRDEIVAAVTKDIDLYTAIQRLRPHFFEGSKVPRSMGMGMVNPLRIYFERNEQPFEILRSTLAWDADEVRYLPPSEAEGRFGGKANGGAILIKIDLKIREKKDTVPKDLF